MSGLWRKEAARNDASHLAAAPRTSGACPEHRKDGSDEGALCLDCLNDVRNAYVRGLMIKDLGDLDAVEQQVIQSMKDR
ncbi:MAG: hypothetical protein R3E66_05775 [bacterium]